MMSARFFAALALMAPVVIACGGEAPAPTGGSTGTLVGGPTPAPAPSAPAPAASAAKPAPSTTSTPAGGACAPQSNDACEVCFVGKCCAQIQACEADAQCNQAYDCYGQCGQTAQNEQQYNTCVQQCDGKYPSGAQKAIAIETCGQQQCAAQCPQQ